MKFRVGDAVVFGTEAPEEMVGAQGRVADYVEPVCGIPAYIVDFGRQQITALEGMIERNSGKPLFPPFANKYLWFVWGEA